MTSSLSDVDSLIINNYAVNGIIITSARLVITSDKKYYISDYFTSVDISGHTKFPVYSKTDLGAYGSVAVYAEDGSLFAVVGDNIRYYNISDIVKLCINVETLELRFEYYAWYIVSKCGNRVLVKRDFFYDYEYFEEKLTSAIGKTDTHGILRFGSLLFVDSSVDNLIVPSEVEILEIGSSSEINSIVCNKELKYIVCQWNYFPNVLYISKSSTKELVCSIIYCLCLMSRFKTCNTDTAYIEELYTKEEYDRLLSYAREDGNKEYMETLLSKVEIIVY